MRSRAPLLALAAALAWGLASVLRSCHLATIPLVVGHRTAGEPVEGLPYGGGSP